MAFERGRRGSRRPSRGRGTINRRFVSNIVRGAHGRGRAPFRGGKYQENSPTMKKVPHFEDNPEWKFTEDEKKNDESEGFAFSHNTSFPKGKQNWRMKNKNIKAKKSFPINIQAIPHLNSSFCKSEIANDVQEAHIESNPDLNNQVQNPPPIQEVTTEIKENIIPNTETYNETKDSVPPTAESMVQPVVDAAEMEKETQKYYEEVMGSLPVSKTMIEEQKMGEKIKKTDPPKVDSQVAWAVMHQYWNYVQENPYDFNGWTVLLNHVEKMENIEAVRSAFEGFLPLYPYCFAYWKKLSDFELKHSNLEICLGVLFCATNSIPLCMEIWVPLFDHFLEYSRQECLSEDNIRAFYEIGLESMGLSWYGSLLWERCINFELRNNNLRRVFALYRRVLKVPLKVYNKHWDRLVALIRDNPPESLLALDEYTAIRKLSCEEMKIVYTPLPTDTKISKASQPDDKLTTTIKEKIVAGLIRTYECNSKEVDKRWKYEDKIKRPYFHVKPLEKRQLKTWNDYLDYEIRQGDPVRSVILFERCLVSCAQYEDMWCRYVAFMEEHVRLVREGKYMDVKYHPGCFAKSPKERKRSTTAEVVTSLSKEKNEEQSKTDKKSSETTIDLPIHAPTEEMSKPIIALEETLLNPNEEFSVPEATKTEVTSLIEKLREGIGVGGRVLTCPKLTPSWILQGVTWEDVRQIYRRATWIHCPSKPLILMQWAEFEESQENTQTARELLNTVIAKHPSLLKARLQLIELERRNGFLDRVDELYGAAFKAANTNSARSFIAIRYARFLFKIKEEDEKALGVLRKALKKDKGNTHLYHHVFDICYQKRPVDGDGVLAAVMLALASKELSLEIKLLFCRKRTDFLKEHGSLAQLKEAKIEHLEYQQKVDAIKLEEARIAKEKEKLELKAKEEMEEKLKAEKKAEEDQKAKEDTSKIPLPPKKPLLPTPEPSHTNYSEVPPTFDLNHPGYGYGSKIASDIPGDRMMYERYDDLLKKGYKDKKNPTDNGQNSYLPPPPIPQGILGESLFNQGRDMAPPSKGRDMAPPPKGRDMAPPAANLMTMPPVSLNEPPPNVLPPPHDGPPPLMRPPFNRINESLLGPPPAMPFRGPRPVPGLMPVPGGGGNPLQEGMKRPLLRPAGIGPPPKMPRLEGPPMGFNGPPERLPPPFMPLKIPPAIEMNAQHANNLPPWFVNEGGNLTISSSPNGNSVIRYWPRYMNEEGHRTLFGSLRKSVKWLQPHITPNIESIEKLLSWIGPCEYRRESVILPTNTSWPPAIVDLLHRLLRFLEQDRDPFNSCLLSLYVNGFMHHSWHSDEHPAMASQPRIATISTGATRILEMRRKDGNEIIRFPLFPGSLLVMEGATQQDWSHQIPREPDVTRERLSLSFRSMLMIKGITV